VVGLNRSIEAPATQVLDGVTYQFKGWGGRKGSTLHLRTPKVAKTLVARYEAAAATP